MSDVKEVERRYRLVEDKERIVHTLGSLDFSHSGDIREVDTYFQSPVRDFIESRECLRVREKDGEATLTWKPPTTKEMDQKGMYWKEELDILLFEQGDKAIRLLKVLGFEVVAVVAKSRSLYKNGRDITLCVDEIDDVGCFIEIEKITDDIDAAIDEIVETAGNLNLSAENICNTPYRDLVIEAHR